MYDKQIVDQLLDDISTDKVYWFEQPYFPGVEKFVFQCDDHEMGKRGGRYEFYLLNMEKYLSKCGGWYEDHKEVFFILRIKREEEVEGESMAEAVRELGMWIGTSGSILVYN